MNPDAEAADLWSRMVKGSLIDSAFYAAKTTFFYLFVGGLVGTIFTLPFVETITHRPFRIPDSLFSMLIGYIVIGMPVAALAGLLYGIRLAISQPTAVGRYLSAAICGMVPSLIFAALGVIWNPRSPVGESLIIVTCVAVFTGLASLVTGWIHHKAERRLKFFSPIDGYQEAAN